MRSLRIITFSHFKRYSLYFSYNYSERTLTFREMVSRVDTYVYGHREQQKLFSDKQKSGGCLS